MMFPKKRFFISLVGVAVVSVVLSVGTVYADENIINVNTATVKELMAIPGIGKVLAERIVEYREEERPFIVLEDLLNIKGIGKETLEKIREHVTVGAKN